MCIHMGIGQECLICVIRLGLVSAEGARCGIISVRAEGGLMRKREARKATRRSF